jgi:hypothetical protein
MRRIGEDAMQTHASPLAAADIRTWRDEGVLILPGFFSAEELEKPHEDFQTIYEMLPPAVRKPTAEAGDTAETAKFHVDQLEAIRPLPSLGAPDLNLLAAHPRLIQAVQSLLVTDDVFLYTSYAWRKDAGQTNYAQPFHRDYPTHQLLVPPDRPEHGAVLMFIYLTDVDLGNGALAYVRNSEARRFGIEAGQPCSEGQTELARGERRAVGPRGTVLLYSGETFHRGTDLTEPGACRHVVGAGYRRSDMPWIGPRRGDFHPVLRIWRDIMEMASPEQLSAYGVPRPGNPYWTERTIRGVEARFPRWNSDPWRIAAGLAARSAVPPPETFQWPSVTEVGGADIDAFISRARQKARARKAGQ